MSLYMSYQTAMMEKFIQSTQDVLRMWTLASNLPQTVQLKFHV